MTLRRSRPRRDSAAPHRDAVLARDKVCTAWRLGFSHECRDSYGNPHAPTETCRLSLEHVKDELRFGRRAASDPAHLVALCHGLNLRPPTKEMRAAFRAYLARVTS